MLKFDTIGISVLLLVFCIEFILILQHRPEKNIVKDMMANFSIGLCIVTLGIFEKGLAFSFFSLVYHFAIFKPNLCWWLWVFGFLSCDFIHYVYHSLGHKTRLFCRTCHTSFLQAF